MEQRKKEINQKNREKATIVQRKALNRRRIKVVGLYCIASIYHFTIAQDFCTLLYLTYTAVNLQLPDSCVSSSSLFLSASLWLLQVHWLGRPDALGKLKEGKVGEKNKKQDEIKVWIKEDWRSWKKWGVQALIWTWKVRYRTELQKENEPFLLYLVLRTPQREVIFIQRAIWQTDGFSRL